MTESMVDGFLTDSMNRGYHTVESVTGVRALEDGHGHRDRRRRSHQPCDETRWHLPRQASASGARVFEAAM